jgi:hypothetical protein
VSATRRIIPMSTNPLVGFAGVSVKIIATRPLRMASCAAEPTVAWSTPSAKPTAKRSLSRFDMCVIR